MLIYLIAATIFMIQCWLMYYTYFLNQRMPKTSSVLPHNNKEFFYFILIPCLNEGKVIKNTLQKLVDLTGKKQIIVIDDDSIDDTLIQAKAVSGPITILQRYLPNARTGKGDSLNNAMPLIKHLIKEKHLKPQNCIVGVIDADGVLSSNSIYQLNRLFANHHTDAVQLRIKMKQPLTILQTFQDIEFFTINRLTQLIRQRLHAVALCGNGQFFRFSSVHQKSGLKPWGNALLEDYELTLKLELRGLNIRYLDEAYVTQEALVKFKDLILQRARWAQGGFNCWHYLQKIIHSRKMLISQKFDTYFFLIQPLINVLADFSILYLTIKFIFKFEFHPEFFIITSIFLSLIGMIFGTCFTIIYRHELRLVTQTKIDSMESNLQNQTMSVRKSFLTVGILSYIYLVLFFSLLISGYHEIIGQRVWNKTSRL